MRSRSLIAIAGLLALFISGCSTTKLTVKAIEVPNPEFARKPITFATFWEAMENADSNYATGNQLDSEHWAFANALARIVAGEVDSAETQLQGLCRSAQDSLVRRHSRKILASLLFSQSKWQELLRMPPDSSAREQGSSDALVKAFSKCLKEEYVFPPQPATIPITLSLSGSPIVEIEVNGHKQKFWLDTGAGLSVVASDIAEECNIPPIGNEKIEAKTGTTKTVDAYPASIAELNFGGILIRNHPAIILKKEDLEFKLLGFIRLLKIDGIIGWNAIQNIAMEIDYSKKLATMKRSVSIHNANRNLFWLGYPIVRLSSQEGVELNFGLDTGGKTTSIRQNIFKKIAGDDGGSKTAIVGSAGGIETANVKVLTRLSLAFNGSLLHFEHISTNPSDPATFIKLDGVLGSDIAQDGNLMLDYQNGSVRLMLSEK